MSKDVDFVVSNYENFNKILRPSSTSNKVVQVKKDQQSSKSFKI